MKRRAIVLSLFAASFLPALALAAYPVPTMLQVQIADHEEFVQEVYGTTDAAQLVELRVVKAGGSVKAYGRELADASGHFGMHLVCEQRLQAGDRLDVVLGGNAAQTYSMVYSQLRYTGIDTATGTMSGIVTPRKARIMFEFSGRRLLPDPVVVAKRIDVTWATAGAGQPTDPAGRFTVRPMLLGPGWEGRFRRGDRVLARYLVRPVPGNRDYSFTVHFRTHVPAAGTRIGSNSHLEAVFSWGRSYTATLLAPGGAVKAVTRFSASYPADSVRYFTPEGAPVAIAPGDTVRISGLGGFTTRVPALRAEIIPEQDTVRIIGPPNARVLVDYEIYDDSGLKIANPPASRWVRINAAGRATDAPAGYDLRSGDRVDLEYQDAAGNVWFSETQSLAPAP